MKNIILITATLLSVLSSKAQITYEHSYPVVSPQFGYFFVTDIGGNNYKYVLHDYSTDVVNIYNLDHTLFLSIQLPLSSDSGARFSVGYITNSLFDCDSSTLEYALLPEQPIYPFKIYRTDGTELFSKDSVYAWWCYGCQEASTEIKTIVNTPEGTKLYLQDTWATPNKVLVYGLCGSLPNGISRLSKRQTFAKVYPNPTNQQITFQITPPSKHIDYGLEIYTSSFQKVISTIVTSDTHVLDLKSQNLSSGVYLYSLKHENEVLQTGKFIVY